MADKEKELKGHVSPMKEWIDDFMPHHIKLLVQIFGPFEIPMHGLNLSDRASFGSHQN